MTERSEMIQLVAAELSYHGRVANAFEISAVLSAHPWMNQRVIDAGWNWSRFVADVRKAR